MTRNGSRRFEVKEVKAKIRSAKLPTRVADSQASSTSSGDRSGLAAKVGLTSS